MEKAVKNLRKHEVFCQKTRDEATEITALSLGNHGTFLKKTPCFLLLTLMLAFSTPASSPRSSQKEVLNIGTIS